MPTVDGSAILDSNVLGATDTTAKANGAGLENSKLNPFTIFIIQNKKFYQRKEASHMLDILTRVMPFAETADEYNALFVFSDVTRISDTELQMKFNSAIAHAFLTSDIFRFINERGNKTVFANEELEYLKESFGPCEKDGDGFYLNLETDRINKLKFIKAKTTSV